MWEEATTKKKRPRLRLVTGRSTRRLAAGTVLPGPWAPQRRRLLGAGPPPVDLSNAARAAGRRGQVMPAPAPPVAGERSAPPPPTPGRPPPPSTPGPPPPSAPVRPPSASRAPKAGTVRSPGVVVAAAEVHDSAAEFEWRGWLVGASWVLLLCAVGALALVAVHQPPSNPPRESSGERAAEAWVETNLASTARISADPLVMLDLTQAGFGNVEMMLSGWSPEDLQSGSFVVVTGPIRAVVTAGLAHAAAISSVPVAVFGTGPGAVAIWLLDGQSRAALATRLSQDRQDRSAADAALLRNPRLRVAAAARSVLRTGRLDIRAATVLALLLARTSVTVSTVTVEPAEAAAGRPARSVTLRVSDRAALTSVLKSLPATYAPRLRALSGGRDRLQWPVGLAPASEFG